MHTPDDPTSTAKRRQTCTHPGTISASQTCNTATYGPWTHDCKSNKYEEHHNNHIQILLLLFYKKRGSIERFGRTSGGWPGLSGGWLGIVGWMARTVWWMARDCRVDDWDCRMAG